MAFPPVASITESPNLSGISHSVALPATVADGDLLIVVHTAFDDQTWTMDTSGWTELYDMDAGNTGPASQTFVKVGAASDADTSVTISNDSGSSRAGSAQVYRITDWSGTLTPGTAGVDHATATGLDDSPDPPSLTAPWGSADTLWIAIAHAADDDVVASSAPTNYTNLTTTLSGGGTNASGATSSARRENATGTENPGTFTLPETEAWVAVTIAVEPADDGGGGGEVLTRSLSDSFTFTDTLAREGEFTRSLGDSLSLSEDLTRNLEMTRALSDTFTLSDTLERSRHLSRALLDSLSLTDTIDRSQSFFTRTLTDNFAISENLEVSGVGLEEVATKLKVLIRGGLEFILRNESRRHGDEVADHKAETTKKDRIARSYDEGNE